MADKKTDVGPDVSVTPAADQPEIQVEINRGVTAFVDGNEVKPGERVYLDAAAAINLVQLGQATIVGSR